MEICALIGSSHHSNDQVSIAPYLLIAHWRFEQMSIVFDPLGEINGFEHGGVLGNIVRGKMADH
jgi:hypothetical protein